MGVVLNRPSPATRRRRRCPSSTRSSRTRRRSTSAARSSPARSRCSPSSRTRRRRDAPGRRRRVRARRRRPELIAGSTRRARIFAGYAGWAPGQLETELGEESWIVEAPLVEEIFSGDPERLWNDDPPPQGRPLHAARPHAEDSRCTLSVPRVFPSRVGGTGVTSATLVVAASGTLARTARSRRKLVRLAHDALRSRLEPGPRDDERAPRARGRPTRSSAGRAPAPGSASPPREIRGTLARAARRAPGAQPRAPAPRGPPSAACCSSAARASTARARASAPPAPSASPVRTSRAPRGARPGRSSREPSRRSSSAAASRCSRRRRSCTCLGLAHRAPRRAQPPRQPGEEVGELRRALRARPRPRARARRPRRSPRRGARRGTRARARTATGARRPRRPVCPRPGRFARMDDRGDTRELLAWTAEHAAAFLAGLPDRPVRRPATLDELRARARRAAARRADRRRARSSSELAAAGRAGRRRDPERALLRLRHRRRAARRARRRLADVDLGPERRPRTSVGPPPRSSRRSPAAGSSDLLGLPAHASFGFVTGCQMAHVDRARRRPPPRARGTRAGTSSATGSPARRRSACSPARSATSRSTARCGCSASAPARSSPVAADEQGRMRADALGDALASGDGPTIVCAQAGNVNTGAFDPLAEIVDAAHAAGAWVHVDGAFGLWAAASPRCARSSPASSGADSWATDAHKWLNVPYDSRPRLRRAPRARTAPRCSVDRALPRSSAEDDDVRDQRRLGARVLAPRARLRRLRRAALARPRGRRRARRALLRARAALRRAARREPRRRGAERRRAQPGARPLPRRGRRARPTHRRGDRARPGATACSGRAARRWHGMRRDAHLGLELVDDRGGRRPLGRGDPRRGPRAARPRVAAVTRWRSCSSTRRTSAAHAGRTSAARSSSSSVGRWAAERGHEAEIVFDGRAPEGAIGSGSESADEWIVRRAGEQARSGEALLARDVRPRAPGARPAERRARDRRRRVPRRARSPSRD